MVFIKTHAVKKHYTSIWINVWIIAEDENGEEYEEYIDLDGDIIIAAYRYLHNEPHSPILWLEKYVD